jgi:hypothetical protein
MDVYHVLLVLMNVLGGFIHWRGFHNVESELKKVKEALAERERLLTDIFTKDEPTNKGFSVSIPCAPDNFTYWQTTTPVSTAKITKIGPDEEWLLVKDILIKYPQFTRNQLTWQMRQGDTNGLNKMIRRDPTRHGRNGGAILIHEPSFKKFAYEYDKNKLNIQDRA